jgi:hypothetical protein
VLPLLGDPSPRNDSKCPKSLGRIYWPGPGVSIINRQITVINLITDLNLGNGSNYGLGLNQATY